MARTSGKKTTRSGKVGWRTARVGKARPTSPPLHGSSSVRLLLDLHVSSSARLVSGDGGGGSSAASAGLLLWPPQMVMSGALVLGRRRAAGEEKRET
jgi:hypothetical protein